MRYYQLSIQRLCGEFVCGRISLEFYKFWKDRDVSELENHIWCFDDPDERNPDSPPMLLSGEAPNGWYEIDDVAHINNAVARGNTLYVEEVVPDDDAMNGWALKQDGYDASFEISDLNDAHNGDLIDEIGVVSIESGLEAPENPVLVCKSIEKGMQTVVVCRDEGAFDIKKLRVTTWDFDGDDVVVDIFYDGKPLENMPDSSAGRAFYAYVGDLDEAYGLERDWPEYEDLLPDAKNALPEPIVEDHAALNDPTASALDLRSKQSDARLSSQQSSAPSWPWVLVLPVILSIAALVAVWLQL